MCCDFGPNFVDMERRMMLFFSGSGVLVWWVFGCPCELGYCVVMCVAVPRSLSGLQDPSQERRTML